MIQKLQISPRQGCFVRYGLNVSPAAPDNFSSAGTCFKALPSEFNGTVFRSRLEARWAVFLNYLGITYEYEFEGYNLSGTPYLPDFFLPEFNGGTYIEVKPSSLSHTEFEKAQKLCTHSQSPVFLATGSPSPRLYPVLFPVITPNFTDTEIYYSNFSLGEKAIRENRFWIEPDQNTYTVSDFRFWFEETYQAIKIAKSYRF